MNLWQRFQAWRLRPGLEFAARLAEQQAWKHPSAGLLGPEMNLMSFVGFIKYRLQTDELYLDATTSSARIKSNRRPKM